MDSLAERGNYLVCVVCMYVCMHVFFVQNYSSYLTRREKRSGIYAYKNVSMSAKKGRQLCKCKINMLQLNRFKYMSLWSRKKRAIKSAPRFDGSGGE